MPTVLDQLKTMTTVVADTGEIAAVRAYAPVDCTTNPSLVLAALRDGANEDLIARELDQCMSKGMGVYEAAATLTVAVGEKLSKLVPGRVSTEVDANLSFDTEASVKRGREIIEDYARRGVKKDRVLIKLAATWEGIRAAETLQREGIDCNLTLLFSLVQAIACADADAYLISPFVGRITDWYKKTEGVRGYAPEADPGVVSVRGIYDYYKSNGIKTIVMGASFRNVDQIKFLAGCDNLTIAPKLLEALTSDTADLPRRLSPETVNRVASYKVDEATFRWQMNADAMASEKLAEGIRGFDKDYNLLLKIVRDKLT